MLLWVRARRIVIVLVQSALCKWALFFFRLMINMTEVFAGKVVYLLLMSVPTFPINYLSHIMLIDSFFLEQKRCSLTLSSPEIQFLMLICTITSHHETFCRVKCDSYTMKNYDKEMTPDYYHPFTPQDRWRLDTVPMYHDKEQIQSYSSSEHLPHQ